jgi:hypothetical protein
MSAPHALADQRLDGRGRLGEWLAAAETASTRDAVRSRGRDFRSVFLIGPEHTPLGPFDLCGAFDERSDRVESVGERIDRGYEDAYRQFIEPQVGGGSDELTP